MARLAGWGVALVALAAVLTLDACARPTGDFGRAAPDTFHDDVMPAIGKQRALAAGEPVSAFNLTDEEREMRDRVWRFLVAPHAYDWFGDTVVELQRTRIAPLSKDAGKRDLYYQWLHGERFASSHVRFARVSDDTAADIDTLPEVFRSICAVREIDRQRGVASSSIAGLEDNVLRDAAARQAENEATIGWFVRALTLRYDAYSYALDHLLVETPNEEAVVTNAGLNDLAVYVETAERDDFCVGNGGRPGAGAVAVRSRTLRSAPDEGPYRK